MRVQFHNVRRFPKITLKIMKLAITKAESIAICQNAPWELFKLSASAVLLWGEEIFLPKAKPAVWAPNTPNDLAGFLLRKTVMREFKELWSSINEKVLEDFQVRRAGINEADVLSALRYGADRAEKNALQTLNAMKEVMGF